MRFFITSILLLAALLAVCIAKPIPVPNLDDIERRWSQGESESSIHAQQSYRDATPAWPVERNALDAVSWDERSAAARNHKRSTGEMTRMKNFVKKFYERKGMLKKAEAVEDMEIAKPKRGMKYPFAS